MSRLRRHPLTLEGPRHDPDNRPAGRAGVVGVTHRSSRRTRNTGGPTTPPTPTVPLAAFEAAEAAAEDCPCHDGTPYFHRCCLGEAVKAAAPHIATHGVRRDGGSVSEGWGLRWPDGYIKHTFTGREAAERYAVADDPGVELVRCDVRTFPNGDTWMGAWEKAEPQAGTVPEVPR